MKLTEDLEQKLKKIMLALFGHQSGFTTGYKDKKAVFGSTQENNCH